MKSLRLNSFFVSAFLSTCTFLPDVAFGVDLGGYGAGASYSYDRYEFPTTVQQLPYVGRIVVSNPSSHVVEVYLRGNQCHLVRKDKRSLVDCGYIFLSPGEQSTFFLDGKNVKESQALWLVLKYPDSFQSNKEWFCYDKFSKRTVDGKQEHIASRGYTAIEIRDSWNDATNSVSCILTAAPTSL